MVLHPNLVFSQLFKNRYKPMYKPTRKKNRPNTCMHMKITQEVAEQLRKGSYLSNGKRKTQKLYDPKDFLFTMIKIVKYVYNIK